jgi:hypothetical protein
MRDPIRHWRKSPVPWAFSCELYTGRGYVGAQTSWTSWGLRIDPVSFDENYKFIWISSPSEEVVERILDLLRQLLKVFHCILDLQSVDKEEKRQ